MEDGGWRMENEVRGRRSEVRKQKIEYGE